MKQCILIGCEELQALDNECCKRHSDGKCETVRCEVERWENTVFCKQHYDNLFNQEVDPFHGRGSFGTGYPH